MVEEHTGPDLDLQGQSIALASPPPDCYTHAPRLNPNLFLGSLQLLFWLLVHPSAWHNYISRIDPALPPDFNLVELSREQWRNPSLQQLLLKLYLVWPVLLGLFVWISG